MIILTSATSNAVVMESNDEMPNGWPLGLGNINSRITMAAPPQPAAASRLSRRSSFSSFSSSNLDTESTASFFPDQSVPLGRLIGIRAKRESENHEGNIVGDEYEWSHHGGPNPARLNNSQGICTPLLHHVIGRIFRRPKHHLHTLLSLSQ